MDPGWTLDSGSPNKYTIVEATLKSMPSTNDKHATAKAITWPSTAKAKRKGGWPLSLFLSLSLSLSASCKSHVVMLHATRTQLIQQHEVQPAASRAWATNNNNKTITLMPPAGPGPQILKGNKVATRLPGEEADPLKGAEPLTATTARWHRGGARQEQGGYCQVTTRWLLLQPDGQISWRCLASPTQWGEAGWFWS